MAAVFACGIKIADNQSKKRQAVGLGLGAVIVVRD
jgi:hypothetical protein